MGIEKLWSVEFISDMDAEGGGVLVLEDGKLLGGNNNYFYIGSYELNKSKISVTIDVKHYAGKFNPIFGKHKEMIIKLLGDYDMEEMVLVGYMLEDTSREFHVRLRCIQ